MAATKMSKSLYTAPMSLVTTLLVLLVVCSASSDKGAASPSSPVGSRKPPFNGSIFGKRSVLPALQNGQDGYNYIATNEDNYGYFGFDLPDRGQLLMQQQETLIRLAINQCLGQQQQRQDVRGDSATSALCAGLLADPKGNSQVQRGSWFDQLTGM